MSRSTHRELIRTFRGLSPAEVVKVKAYIARLRDGLPTREDDGGDDAGHASPAEVGNAPQDAPRDASDRRDESNASVTQACSFWGRRPLHAVAPAQFEPIAALLREALDQRDARRQRFG
ncbi:MAG: hypothetical protein AB7P21_13125 [Lautropia sp.]